MYFQKQVFEIHFPKNQSVKSPNPNFPSTAIKIGTNWSFYYSQDKEPFSIRIDHMEIQLAQRRSSGTAPAWCAQWAKHFFEY